MTAKVRMSIKLTRDQRRLVKRLAKQTGLTMTDVLVRGLELVSQKLMLAAISDAGGGDVPPEVAPAVDLIPLKR